MTFSIKKKTLKKIVSSLTMFATVVSMSGFMALSTVVAADAVADGALIKSDATNSDGTPTLKSLDVYIVKLVGTKSFKRLILNPTVFESYGHLNWGDIQTITQAEMDGYTTSSLVRVDTDPDEKVYAMAPDGDIGAKSWVNLTVGEFVTDAGSDPDSIYTINATDGGNYTTVGDVTTVTELTTFYSTGDLPDLTPVPAGDLTASLSATTPASTNIVAGQAIADLAQFVFSGTGTVSQVTLQRNGISANTDLTNVYLFDGVTRVSDSASVSTDGVISFNNVDLSVAGTKVVSVKADIATAAVGTIGVTMTSYTTTGSAATTVSLAGNLMSVVSATLATVAVGTVSPTTATTVNAGTNGFVFWSAPITVGTRSVNLKSAAYQFIGSAPTDSLENIKLFVNGTDVSTSAGVNSMGYIVFDLSAAPTALQTGSSTVEVRADVVKGSSRTITLALQNVADLTVADSQLGVNIASTGLPKTAGTVTVNAGSVTVTTDPTFTATTVTGGVTNQTLARYNFKAFGEDVKISYLDVTPSINIDNVVIFADGGQISSNIQSYTGTKLHFATGSSLIIPAGETVAVEVRADTKAAGVNITTGTVAITLNGYANNAQGVSSSTLTTVPAADQTGPTLTIGVAALTLATTSSFIAAQNIIANTANQRVGSYTITAGSSEGVKLTNINVDLTLTTLPVANMSNLYIKYGATSSTPINPQATTNNFPVDITVAASGNVVVDVYADVGSNTTVTNTNTTPQTMPIALTTPATSSVVASSASVFASATGTSSMTVNGLLVTAAAGGASDIIDAAAMVSALNTNPSIFSAWIATNSGTATVTLTRRTAGIAGNFTVVTSSTGGAFTTAVSPTVNGTDGAIQVDWLTPANVEIGDVFTAGIGAASVSFTATAATPANVTAGITSAWIANATLAALATAADATTHVTLTAVTAGTAGAFTTVASAANGSHSSVGLVIRTTLSMSAIGTTSNSTVASAPATLAGQTMTLTTGSLAVAGTVTSNSPVDQFVVGGTTGEQLAIYKFTASNGTAVIDELRFTIAPSGGDPIASLTVDGITQVASGTLVTLTGLNIEVPVGYSGLNVPVLVDWNPVGLGQQATAQTANIDLTYIKYHVGNTTTIDATPVVAPSNTMYAVASFPIVSVTGQSVDGIIAGENKLMDVKITANSGGDIKLTTLVFTNAIASGAATIGSLAPRLAIGNTTLSGTGYTCSGTTTVTCTFPNDYIISAGEDTTFSLYGTVTGPLGGVSTTSLTTTLGASSTFSWTDVTGGGSAVTGGTNTSYLQNWPTASWTIGN